MRLDYLSVQGYRSLREVTIPFSRLTTLIGSNGSGKSSILRALRLFCEPSLAVSGLDFWCGTNEEERATTIAVTARWQDLTKEHQERFSSLLDENNGLIVERRFEKSGTGVYLVSRPAVPQFSMIRKLDRGHREEYDKLRIAEFESLPAARNKEEVFAAMTDWEEKYPDRCVVSAEEFSQIDDLLEKLTFLSIGAFEDPESHLNAEGSGAVSRLISLVVNQTGLETRLGEIAERASTLSAEALAAAKGELDVVGESMADMITAFAPGCGLHLKWDEQIDVHAPRTRLKIEIQTSDGPIRPLEYQGHGVQRSLMYAALTAALTVDERDDQTVILVIEEPEAFQHPLSSRVLARTLRRLSSRNFQVAYSTHSSEFIHADIVEGLRIVRRTDEAQMGHASTINTLTATDLVDRWETIFDGEGYTPQSVLARLSAHLSPQVLEGLFAKFCVLVEGDEDEALLRGAAEQEELDLDAVGIAVIQTNGKNGIPNVLGFLALAGVECFPVFDLDRSKKDKKEQHREAESQVLNALSLEGPVEAGVHDQYACWTDNMGTTFREELGEDLHDALLLKSAESFGYPRPSRAKKVPVVITDMLRRASEEGVTCPSLTELATLIEHRATSHGLDLLST